MKVKVKVIGSSLMEEVEDEEIREVRGRGYRPVEGLVEVIVLSRRDLNPRITRLS